MNYNPQKRCPQSWLSQGTLQTSNSNLSVDPLNEIRDEIREIRKEVKDAISRFEGIAVKFVDSLELVKEGIKILGPQNDHTRKIFQNEIDEKNDVILKDNSEIKGFIKKNNSSQQLTKLYPESQCHHSETVIGQKESEEEFTYTDCECMVEVFDERISLYPSEQSTFQGKSKVKSNCGLDYDSHFDVNQWLRH